MQLPLGPLALSGQRQNMYSLIANAPGTASQRVMIYLMSQKETFFPRRLSPLFLWSALPGAREMKGSVAARNGAPPNKLSKIGTNQGLFKHMHVRPLKSETYLR